jgi:phage tail sheath protein FI
LNIKQFAAPFFGGFDGNNILVENPYNEDLLGTSTSYAKHTVDQALEMVSDRDLIRYDLIAIPGITNSTLNGNLLRQTEERGDALAIVDFDGIFQSSEDTGGTESPQSITTIIRTINDNGFNTSYGAAYYPNVRMRDTLSGNGSVLFAPPSVAAIGAIGKSEADSQPWFAPAGFQRGGLNPLGGTAGPQVLGTVEHLTKADRDKLYEVNLNPIARFPATGDTVVFGQKTLQQDASALDRINVRRLMNYLKKEIGDIADTILFDQNVQATWNRFKAEAETVLSQVKAQFGVTEYKLVLDETTTTPDLIDRNILYAKVFVKPARAIEFIAVDFVITQSGVEF